MRLFSRLLCFLTDHDWEVTKWEGKQRNYCSLCGQEEMLNVSS